jgi:hypothetical protein
VLALLAKSSLRCAFTYSSRSAPGIYSGKTSINKRRVPTPLRPLFHRPIVRFGSESRKLASEMDELPPFEYSPLNPLHPEIRLLKVMPAEHQSESILNCDMITVRLESKPEYVALSYVWGSPARTQPILLNGQPFKVTVNLENFLLHFRNVNAEMVPLWIDAICINQDDNNEKSTEVQRLRTIFRGATSVLAWLGPSTKSTITAMKKMNEFDDYYLHSSKSLEESAEDFLNIQSGNGQKFAGIREIQTLMQQLWFKRVWIVQEVAVANRLHYRCGSESVPGKLIPTLVSAIENAVLKKMRKMVDDSIWEDGRMTIVMSLDLEWDASKFYRLVDLVTQKENAPSLWDLLLAFKECGGQASDPRDYIFALLGLSRDADKLGLRPDYSQSFSSCYTQVATAFLRHGQF